MSTQQPATKSITSTWRQKDRSEWNIFHWTYEVFRIHPVDLDKEIPVHLKTDKVPYLNDWYQHRWILAHAFAPIVLHHLYCAYTGRNLTAWQAVAFYSIAFKLNAIRELHILRKIGEQTGFLDGDVHGRDGVPDTSVFTVLRSLVATSTFRPIFTVFLAYHSNRSPSSMNLYMLPFETGFYAIVLDFWFYWYHRLMHTNNDLWKYHRTHHLTKHPNPLLTLYADSEQEFFDIAGIPLVTFFTMKWIGFPMGFYEWWVCHQYIVFAELAGHSGLRVAATPPNPFNWILRQFSMELIIEDHDLHHRRGAKTSFNYSKQTRIWDVVFDTCGDRVECLNDNVDWNAQVTMPIF